MNQLHIAPESLGNAASGITSLASFADLGSQSADTAPIDTSYSRASGFDQLGTIHGRSLNTAPGSAAGVFGSLAHELGLVIEHLGATRSVVTTQDLAASLAFSLADMGGAVEKTTEAFTARSATGTSPLYKAPVVVVPDFSLSKLVNDLNTTNSGAALASQGIWGQLASHVDDIAGGMIELSSYIGAENLGVTADAISARLHDIAGRSRIISANSRIFETNLGSLEATRGTRAAEVALAQAEIEALKALGPKGVAAAQVAEQMFLQYYAVSTQGALTALIPPVINLTSPDLGNPGGIANPGMENVDGSGTRYSTSGITAPQRIADGVLDFVRSNPESFERINSVTRDMATSTGSDLGEGLFSPQGINTAPATAGTTFSPPSPVAGTTTLGSPAIAGAVPTSLTGSNPGLAALPGLGASGASAPRGAALGAAPASQNSSPTGSRLAGTTAPSAVPNAGNSTASVGAPMNPTSAIPGAARAGTPIGSRGSLSAGPGQIGSGASRLATSGQPPATTGVGQPLAGGLRPMPSGNGFGGDDSTHRRFAGGSAGSAGLSGTGSGGSSGSAANDGDGARRAFGGGAHGSGAFSPLASNAGPNSNHSAHREGGPMMGPGGRANGGNKQSRPGKIHSVTSTIEREGNLRELLGERPAAVPGVIGDWARSPEGS